jgi:exopolyphosphatase/guanosine-5'-triphosphate,3'-diphosphate pyrophosphatase
VEEEKNYLRFAAVNIGSNAVRLFIANVFENNNAAFFKKANLVRLPIRLGDDSFLEGKISDQKIDRLLSAMKAYKELMNVYNPIAYRICATSAMREASNSKQIVDLVLKETGLKIEVIDGKTEADIIYSNHIAENLDKNYSYLYVDVGGGSTEVSLFSRNQIVASKSFSIGTIRMMYNQVDKYHWNELKEWVKDIAKGQEPLLAIGSGGNINRLLKMANKKDNKYIGYEKLKSLKEMIESHSIEERVQILDLNPDRADVIIPASKIYLTVMKMAEISRIYVPQIGLADGMIHLLYEDYKKQQ